MTEHRLYAKDIQVGDVYRTRLGGDDLRLTERIESANGRVMLVGRGDGRALRSTVVLGPDEFVFRVAPASRHKEGSTDA